MKNFPERLKAARLMNGFSMQDLADELDGKISKQAIGRYEKGLMQPTGKNLLLLCNSLGVRPDFFNRNISINLENVAFRKLKRLPAKKQEAVKQKTSDYLERYLELEELLGIENEFQNPIGNIEIEEYSDVEDAAMVLRHSWNIGEDTLSNIVETIEENGIKVFELETDSSFSGMSAEISQNQRVIVLNGNNEIPIERKRFTALHELGHQLLNLEKFSTDEKTQEKMCNYFAGAILFPASTMKKELGEKRHNIHIKELLLLKEEYGISMQAIIYRAKNLNIISEHHFKQQMITFSRLGIRKNEPGEFCGKEHSNRFLQLILRGVAEEVISTSKAASLYNVKLAEFRKELTQLN